MIIMKIKRVAQIIAGIFLVGLGIFGIFGFIAGNGNTNPLRILLEFKRAGLIVWSIIWALVVIAFFWAAYKLFKGVK